MRRLLCGLLLFSGCGFSSRNTELVGQVKKVVGHTPIICPDYNSVDVSLGVMRNGVGSMSTQDVWLYVSSDTQTAILKHATENGLLVKVTYNEKRLTWCVPDKWVTSVEVLK